MAQDQDKAGGPAQVPGDAESPDKRETDPTIRHSDETEAVQTERQSGERPADRA